MSQSLIFDLLLVLIFAASLFYGAARGAFRALSGLLGTVLGFFAAQRFVSAAEPLAAQVISPFVKMAVNAAAKNSEAVHALDSVLTQDLVAVFGRVASALKLSPELGGRIQAQAQAAQETMFDALVDGITHWLAPMVAFVLIFVIVRLAVALLCRMLSTRGIPIVSTINKLGGALIGALYGLVTVVVICWAVLSFAPEEPQGFICKPVARESIIGGAIASVIE